MIDFSRGCWGLHLLTTRLAADRAGAVVQSALAFLAVALLAGAGAPDIIRARVPAKEVSRLFPAGTELRVMPARQFESLVVRATEGSSRRRAAEPPRLIRASHHARFSSGALAGRSEFVIAAAGAGPTDFALDPWTPATLAAPRTGKVLGARDSGKPSLWIDQTPNQTIVVDWELQPRAHERGRSFALALPGNDTTVLSLDVPRNWVPLCRQGRRRGPLASTDGGDQNHWEIEPEAGRIDLQLCDPGAGSSLVETKTWLWGSTQIDLRRPADRPDALVNWKTEWRLELDPRNPRPLEIELDPGLELIDVQGPAVRGYHSERSGTATRLAVTLDSGLQTSTELRLLAHAPVPSEGLWSIPGLRPLSATWTGGTTTVLLDEFHVLKEYREKAGRRVFPSGPGAGLGSAERLDFEATAPQSVAELVFRRPRADTSCEIRGRLFVTGSPARFECELKWDIRDGAMSELEIDLSPAWLPDRVTIRGNDDPLVWHSSILPSGNTRVHVALPAATSNPGELVVIVGATSTVSGGRGPLHLPRVRPVRAPIHDETWVARVDQGTLIQPTLARGLAWIDPAEVPGLTGQRGTGSGADLREALAWRWIAETADARVERHPVEQEPAATIRVHARIDPTRQRLVLDGRLQVYAGLDTLDSVPLWIGHGEGLLEPWRCTDEAGSVLAMRPIDQPDRSRLGFPEEGSARSLVVRIPYHTQKTIDIHAEYAWRTHGLIPLVSVSRDYLSRGMIVFEAPAMTRCRAKAAGLRRLAASAVEQADPEADDDMTAGDRDDSAPPQDRPVEAFLYTEPGGRLEMFTEPLSAPLATGIVREAHLTTSVDPGGTLLNRLRLLVNLGEAHALDLLMPRGLALVRVRRDGVDVAPMQSPTGVSIPLTASAQGSKSTTIVVDYMAERAMVADGDRLQPELPRISLPCLSFVWEIVTSPAWRATDEGPGLIGIGREEPLDWPYAATRLSLPGWYFGRRRGHPDNEEMLRSLDERLADSASAGLTFAEWFSRWDSGPWPVVIDRVALDSAGLGPKSQCMPTTAKGKSRSAALATLKRHGLALVPFENACVITTEAELPRFQPHDRWATSFAEAMSWGSDRTDRFQALARWRGEPSPKLGSAIGEEAAARVKTPPGWTTWRFEGPGWPEKDAFVYLIDVRKRLVTGWLIGVSCLLAWGWVRRWLGRWRSFFLASLMVLCLIAQWLLPSRYACDGTALELVAAGLLLIELGRHIGRPHASGRAGWRTESSLVRRGGAAVGVVVVAIVIGLELVGSAVSVHAAIPTEQGPAIPAIFPYEGPFDPARPVKDVILRLADFNRLTLLAASEVPRPSSWVRAVAAVHRVTRKSRSDVVIESEIELTASGRAPFAWTFPVAEARDIEVTLDGKRLPVAIEPGGARGRVPIAQAGEHRLQIRRSTATITEDTLERISIPVNASPFARVVVEPGTDGRQDGEPIARGRTEIQPDHSLTGRLGPVDRVEVRWYKPAGAAVERAKGNVQGLILWDITPAGDRVRTRLSGQRVAPVSTIRFAHEQGLILRSARAPGTVEVSSAENAGKGEWILHVDPPLPAGSTIELDCWLPLGAAAGSSIGKSRAATATPEGSIRDLPLLEPLGVEKYSGSLGVRRPGDWTGRFDPLPGTEPISDESFVESWGSLPVESLTLCGTSRFVHACRATLQTGPVPTRIQINPTMHIQLEPGRVAIMVEAELSELAGHLHHVAAMVPERVQIIEVTADGLSHWTTSGDHRLHLWFDRPFAQSKRRLRILASIPLNDDPLRITARQLHVNTPWFGWEGMDVSAGFVMISSTAKPELRGSTGLTLISSESSGIAVTSAPRHRLTYRVDDPGKLGEILWASPPARVNVAMESQMTIHPDSAEWVSVLRYDVIGGALDAIRFRMPAAWAANADLRFSGSKYQLTRETSGPFTLWTITPERPIWGSQRFVLRATRPLDADREIDYPEISPLGPGAVDAYVGVINATDQPLSTENTLGLQPIPFATKFRAGEFATGVGTAVGAFRVVQESWTLRVQSPRSTPRDGDARGGSARVDLADLMVVVLPDRSILGRAIYDTVPGTGTVMPFLLPVGSSVLWATVDLSPVVPLRSSTGTWSIACDDRRASRIGLIWKTGPPSPGTTGSRSFVPLPRAGTGPALSLVSVYAPPGLVLGQGEYAPLEPAAMIRLEMARADWLDRCVNDLVAKFDRSSGRDHEKLVSLLISHEMALRGAQRSVEWSSPGGIKSESVRVKHEVDLIRAARAARNEAIERAGLDDDLGSARIYLGERLANLSRPLGGVPEPSAPERIRSLGRPFTLIGFMPGTDRTSSGLSLTLERQPWEAIGEGPLGRSGVAMLLLGTILLLLALPGRGTWQSVLALVAALGLAGYTGGPVILAGGLGMTALGWKTARG